MNAQEQKKPATPAWITALPGYQPDKQYNHFEIAGANWQQDADIATYLYQTQPPLDPAIGVKRHLRLYGDGDSFKWEASLWIDEEPTRIARFYGQSETLEGAAAAALAHRHETIELGGAIWYADTSLALDRRTYAALIGTEEVEVKERHDGRWEWSRAVDLSVFRAAGLYAPSPRLEGEADTAIKAMLAAMDAPKALRRACRDFLCAGGQMILSDYVPHFRPMYRRDAEQAAAH